MISDDDIEQFFSGDTLFGNNFTENEIFDWFENEKNSYYDLTYNDMKYQRKINQYQYYYSAKNRIVFQQIQYRYSMMTVSYAIQAANFQCQTSSFLVDVRRKLQ